MRDERTQFPMAAAELDEAYRSHSPWLKRAIGRRFGAGALDIEDLVQDTFLRLGRYSQVNGRWHLKALLLRIATNLAVDRYRRRIARAADAHVCLEEPATAHDPRLSVDCDQEALLDVKQAVMSLPEPLRDVFVLARFTTLTQAEIASRLGISVKTVEWRLARASAACLGYLGR